MKPIYVPQGKAKEYGDYFAIGFCFYDGEKFQLDPAYKVTHWMPMPELPL